MEPLFDYGSRSVAIAALKDHGFNSEFSLVENVLYFNGNLLETHQFRVVHVYHYQGDTNPTDEDLIYAIVSNLGVKGILVIGYNANMEAINPNKSTFV